MEREDMSKFSPMGSYKGAGFGHIGRIGRIESFYVVKGKDMKPKRVYRKRQWTRQAARKFAKVAKRWARKKPKWHKSLSNVADLASAYAIGKMLQVRLLNSVGVEIGWRDEPNPFKWINEMPDALRVKPKEKKPCSH
jgi:hypothetical protein